MASKLTLDSTFNFRVSIDGDTPRTVKECKLSDLTVGWIVNCVRNNAVQATILIGGVDKNEYVIYKNDEEVMKKTIMQVIEDEKFEVDTFVNNIIDCLIEDDYSLPLTDDDIDSDN
ncbi:hypothetical protein GGI19_003922 [Coemansia pectinata]|uniref:Uncharacterized protein n=1 Tax=Coemansia pectinata TaxID=1052879 RepID=A0A9W8GX18_9FUNG|nr:hypothetical protein GGI19_003922 [Coemansia pectinata]